MIYNLKKYRAINKFLTIDWNSNRYYNESIFILSGHTPRRIKPVMAYLHDKTILQLHHSGIMAKTI